MIIDTSRRRQRRRIISSGMGSVSALVIGAQTDLSPAELRRRGMASMGDGLLETVGKSFDSRITTIQGKLSDVETLLKISTAASVLAMAVAAYSAFRRKST